MAYSLNTLTQYTEQNATALKTRAFFSSPSLKLFEVIKGIKGPTALNKLANSVFLQAGGCGWNASGTTTISQRVLTPGSWKVQQAWCPKDLEQYFTRKYLSAGQIYKDQPGEVEAPFMEDFMGQIGEIFEKQIWQGDIVNGTSTSLNKFDGLNLILDVATSANTFNPATSAWTKSTSFDIIDGMVLNAPTEIDDKTDTTIIIGRDKFKQYAAQLRTLNLFHYSADIGFQEGDNAWTITHPGTNVKVIGVPGLNGTNRIWLLQLSNVVVAVDDAFESTAMEMFWAQEAREVRFDMEGMMGVNAYYTNQILRQVTN